MGAVADDILELQRAFDDAELHGDAGRLLAGQLWAVPLSNDRHACGRVLHVPATADSLYLNAFASLVS
jgi:hypothetical protein